jgi:hypothetical protein
VSLWFSPGGGRLSRGERDSPQQLIDLTEGCRRVGSVIKKRRKRMSKKKHRKLLRKTRVQRRKLGK